MRIQPVVFVWKDVDVIDEHGEVHRAKAMVPLPRYANVAGRQFADGEEYPMGVVEERSKASHDGFHAQVNEAFKNLPEKIAARWPTATHLRRWCLVECNWFDEKEFECPDETFARRLATFIRTEDEYARILIHHGEGWKVIVRRAKSQSVAAMGKEAFEASKKDTLDYLSSLIGSSVGDLKKNAGKSS